MSGFRDLRLSRNVPIRCPKPALFKGRGAARSLFPRVLVHNIQQKLTRTTERARLEVGSQLAGVRGSLVADRDDKKTWDDSLDDIVKCGDILADKYRVEGILGTGGMGIVVEAWHTHFDESVAIKFLLPDQAPSEQAMRRFNREAKAAFKIKSEHAARIYDVGTLDNGSPYMVMELLKGEDLAEVIGQRAPLPGGEAAEYIIQACEAVAEAHANGIIHRDLKPENLYLTKRHDRSPCIKVLDFGISKFTDSAAGGRKANMRALTVEGAVMGTPFYMAPEQWASARDVEPAADQWALGVILYELVTGELPFEHPALAKVCGMVLNDPPPPLKTAYDGAPTELEPIIFRALEKLPEERYRSVGDFAAALREFAPRRAHAAVSRAIGVLHKSGIIPKEALSDAAEPMARSRKQIKGSLVAAPTQVAEPTDDEETDRDAKTIPRIRLEDEDSVPSLERLDAPTLAREATTLESRETIEGRHGRAAPTASSWQLPLEPRKKRWPWLVVAGTVVALGAGAVAVWQGAQQQGGSELAGPDVPNPTVTTEHAGATNPAGPASGDTATPDAASATSTVAVASDDPPDGGPSDPASSATASARPRTPVNPRSTGKKPPPVPGTAKTTQSSVSPPPTPAITVSRPQPRPPATQSKSGSWQIEM